MTQYDESNREIPGFNGYFATAHGDILSKNKNMQAICQRVPTVGYPIVTLYRDKKGHTKYVHRLVLESHVGPCPDGCEALHSNGIRMDNRLGNLRWGTRKENVADMVRHGTATIGEKNKQAKLSAEDVSAIRGCRDICTAVEFANILGVSRTTIDRVIRNETYKMESRA